LFRSESRRNPGSPLSLILWSKVVESLAERAGVPRFTTHTPRHLRLTHLARAHMDLHQIAIYAGHKSLQTTMLYLHMSGIELTEAVSRSLAGFEQWMAHILEGSRT
jgi:integrase/recombinase XerD